MLQGTHSNGVSGSVALRPDYLLLDSVGRRYVLPARLALTSGQDWGVPRSRVDVCVLTDVLNFATQSQLWLLSNSPRPDVCSPTSRAPLQPSASYIAEESISVHTHH